MSRVKAETLKESALQKRLIIKTVSDILDMIDEKIILCHDAGQHELNVSLPTIFDIPGMSNANAQRRIYSSIILDLKRREFTVKLRMSEDSTECIVTWITAEEKKDVDMQYAIIAAHSLKE